MTKKEYLKYNSIEAYDMYGRRVLPNDTVVINNNYGSRPRVGIVSHYTPTGKLAIKYASGINNTKVYYNYAYRKPKSVLKLDNINGSTYINKV